MRKLGTQRGVAMVTVLLVGAALTVVGSTATFVTIRELRQGTADGKAAAALAYAEAGVDRFFLEIRRGVDLNFNRIFRAGCEDTDYSSTTLTPWLIESGLIGNGSYRATLEVVDCAARPFDGGSPAKPDPSGTLIARIRSVGQHPAVNPTARRVIEQDVEITALGLPVGIFADSVDANGNGNMLSISLVSPGDVHGRDKMGFQGLDPYYTKQHFYNNGDASAMPSSAHAAGRLTMVRGGGTNVHPPSPNCDASTLDAQDQSLWDGDGWTDSPGAATVTSGCTGQTGFPPTSLFTTTDLARVTPTPDLDEDAYSALADAARSSGIYCRLPGSLPCTINGVPGKALPDPFNDVDIAGLSKQFVAYFDFTTGDPLVNQIKWKADVTPCSEDPAVHRSLILVVRNGGGSFQDGTNTTGAIIAADGQVNAEGGFAHEGTIIAKEFRYRGNATISMSECWVTNMPGPWLKTTASRWTEVDR